MVVFDVGSTLMDEEKAYLHRLHDVADTVNEPFEKIYEMAVCLYKQNRKGNLEVMQSYGLLKFKWHKEDGIHEPIYKQKITILKEK